MACLTYSLIVFMAGIIAGWVLVMLAKQQSLQGGI